MDLSKYKVPIVGAVSSIVAATVVGAFSAFLALKDTAAKQEVAIAKLTEKMEAVNLSVNNMSNRVDDWNRSVLLVQRHDDYLKKLSEIITDVMDEEDSQKTSLNTVPWFSKQMAKEEPRIKLLMPAPPPVTIQKTLEPEKEFAPDADAVIDSE